MREYNNKYERDCIENEVKPINNFYVILNSGRFLIMNDLSETNIWVEYPTETLN